MLQKKLPRILLALVVLSVWLGLPALAAEGDQLDADIRLFTVLAAINASGYDDGYSSPSDSPVRHAVREALADFQGSSRTLLKNFYEENKLPDPGENLSQYVSYALICDGPPEFALQAELPTDLPPDVSRIRGLSRLLAEFFQQADIEGLWNRYQPAFEQEIARYQEPLIRSLFRASGYLREPPNSLQNQKFRVLFDLLGAPNSINTRSYRGIVYVVVHHAPQPRIDEIRQAYLVHLLDRLSIRNAGEIAKKDVLARSALFAPALDEMYKTDFQLLVTKSLVKAVDVQLSRMPEAEKRARIDRDLREGFILTPYFYEKLPEYEKQAQPMSAYYPDLIKGIDTGRELARLQKVEFAPAQSRPAAQQAARPKLSETDKLLQQAETLLRANRLDQSRAVFEQALDKSGGRSAQASYGLARVSVSEADPELALEYFQRALESTPDSAIEAMSHVYIGRIEDIMGNREQALRHYRLALEVRGIPSAARELAEKGLQEQFQSPRQQQDSDPDEPEAPEPEAPAPGPEQAEPAADPAEETAPKPLQ
jgi:tetratricopeptide (TPR) repeat protein